MNYNQYRYIFPPRPKIKIKPATIDSYEGRGYVLTPKYNGDCSVIFISPEGEVTIRNRHDEPKDHVDREIAFGSLKDVCPGWLVLTGEMLDKAKKDEHGNVIKGWVAFDALVYDSKYLLGSTFIERMALLETIMQPVSSRISPEGKLQQYDYLYHTRYNKIFLAPFFETGFEDLYNDLIKTDLYEGAVLKIAEGKLQPGMKEDNNIGWSVKVRKPTKNYHF